MKSVVIWDERTKLIKKKLKKITFLQRNLNKDFGLPKLRQVYLALMESIITYGIIGWGGSFDNTISQLQICQNQIMIILYSKIIYGTKRAAC